MQSAVAKQPRPLADPSAPPILRDAADSAARVGIAPSADDRQAGHEASDIIEREQTFERFLSLLVVAVLHIASCLIALAIGGIEGHWALALVFVAFATAAAISGAFVQSIGWKPGAIMFAVEALAWLALA